MEVKSWISIFLKLLGKRFASEIVAFKPYNSIGIMFSDNSQISEVVAVKLYNSISQELLEKINAPQDGGG